MVLVAAYARSMRASSLFLAFFCLQASAHTRDLRADFLRSYRNETTVVPPLLGIGIGANADNTGGSSLAYVDALSLMEQ